MYILGSHIRLRNPTSQRKLSKLIINILSSLSLIQIRVKVTDKSKILSFFWSNKITLFYDIMIEERRKTSWFIINEK